MQERLICPQCVNTLVDPVALDCPHHFCYSCASDVYKADLLMPSKAQDKLSFKCPICQTPTTLKEPGQFEVDDQLSAQLLSIREEQAGRMFSSKRTATFPDHQMMGGVPHFHANRDVVNPALNQSSGRHSNSTSTSTGRIQELRRSLLQKFGGLGSSAPSSVPVYTPNRQLEMEEFEMEMGGMESPGSPTYKNEMGADIYDRKPSPQEFVFDGQLSDITEEKFTSKEVSEHNTKMFYSKENTKNLDDFDRPVLSLQATPRSQGPGSLFHKYDSAQRCAIHSNHPLEYYSMKAREFLCGECVQDRNVSDHKRVDDVIHELTNTLELDMFRPLEQKLREAKEYLEKQIRFIEDRRDKAFNQIESAFHALRQRLEQRRQQLKGAYLDQSHQYVSQLSASLESVTALHLRCLNIMDSKRSDSPVINIRMLERAHDFLKGVRGTQLPERATFDITMELNEEQLKEALEDCAQLKSRIIVQNIDNLLFRQNLPDSLILPESAHTLEVLQVLPVFSEVKLLYRMSHHGPSNIKFHSLCDNQGSTLTLVKLHKGHIFGGFASESWDSEGGFRRDQKAYLFSLADPHGRRPFICPLRGGDDKLRAVFHGRKYGPLFGRQDLSINLDKPEKSCSRLGFVYDMPAKIRKAKPETILAGSFTDWNVEEIEVYAITVSFPKPRTFTPDFQAPVVFSPRSVSRSNNF